MGGDLDIRAITRVDGERTVRILLDNGVSFLTGDDNVLNFDMLNAHAMRIARGGLQWHDDWENHVRKLYAKGKRRLTAS